MGSMCNRSAHSTLILDCRQLMRRIPSMKIKHCYREVYQCVVQLAKNGADQQHDFTVFANPATEIILLMYYDSMGLYYEMLSL